MIVLRSMCAVIVILLLVSCTVSGDVDPAAPSGAITTSTLPVSVADVPQAAALRTALRIALVIGNDHYSSSWEALRFPGADARAIAQSLRARGFELVGGDAHIDVSSVQFHQLLAATERAIQAKPGAIVAVFFSGHGFADQGHNYLAPSDAPEAARAIPVSLGVSEIARRLNAAGSGLTMMFLDACRDYEPGRGGGLEDEAVADNTFVGFATMFGTSAGEPTDTAANGHSYYTAALLRALDAGMDRLDDLHLAVAAHVLAATQGRQSPVYRESKRMPATPIRLAVNDPQTAFALARRQGAAEGDALAAQCAAMSDLRLIAGFTSPSYLGSAMKIGPRYEPVDLPIMASSCRAAYTAGGRQIAVLRGLALAGALTAISRGDKPTTSLSSNTLALLAQAAEGGDAMADFILAAMTNSPTELVGLQADAVRDRLLDAAEKNQAPITGLVGLLLWRPEMTQLRGSIGLPRDQERGLQLFQRAVVSGDPLLQPLAMSWQLKSDPAVANLPLREGLRRALQSSSAVGFYFEGLSVHQSLYFFVIFDALAGILGPKDPGEMVRLTLEAEPFLAELGQSYVRATGRPNAADGYFILAACVLASGRDQSGALVPGIIPNRQVALRLLQETSNNPPADLRKYIYQLANGGTCQ